METRSIPESHYTKGDLAITAGGQNGTSYYCIHGYWLFIITVYIVPVAQGSMTSKVVYTVLHFEQMGCNMRD